MLRNRIKYYLLKVCILVSFIVFVCSCANIVPPNGGPRDITPPQVVKHEPENQSINFNGSSIKIVFDEYIQLKNLNQQFMVSPPLKNFPDISVRGKTLIIKLNDTLNENTTYNLYFGNSLVDITEGNALNNYQYVFSTGKYLDSMSVRGSVYNAEDLKPIEDVCVMLYENTDDSVPYLQKPLYITKTDKTGGFKLNNLKNIPYKIFALNDANNNMLFDLPYEKIAFLDSIIMPDYTFDKKKASTDTLTDSDTLTSDSSLHKPLLPPPPSYKMFMFEQIDSNQRVLKKNLDKKGLVVISFKFPVIDFNIVYPDIKEKSIIIEEFNNTKDTLRLWIKDLSLDSLFALIYQKDSILDTIQLSLKPRPTKRATEHKLLITSNASNNTAFNYFIKPVFEFNTPVLSFISDSVVLKEDSLKIKAELVFRDSAKRILELCNPLKEETNYEVFFPPSGFKDIFNAGNDTLRLSFKTRKKEDYGNLILNVAVPHEKHQFIVQLLNDKNIIIEEKIIRASQKIEFPHIEPNKYFVKIIFDKNNDNKWNTGSYTKKIQAEKVQLIKGEITSRANWDVEVEIKIEE